MLMRAVSVFAVAALCLAAVPTIAHAGPETSLREFASGQIKKGVRSIGMGGDGATLGNYALVYRDAGGAILDYGLVHFSDTGNDFTFTAVGFTTPTFWDDTALYVIAMSEHATNVRVWSAIDPTPSKPPSTGDGSNQGVFGKSIVGAIATLTFDYESLLYGRGHRHEIWIRRAIIAGWFALPRPVLPRLRGPTCTVSAGR